MSRTRSPSSCGATSFEHVVIAEAGTARPIKEPALHSRQPPIQARRPLEPARGITRRQYRAQRTCYVGNEERFEKARTIAGRRVVDSQAAPLASIAAESAKRTTTVATQQVPPHLPGHEAAHDHPDEWRVRCEPRRQCACERREIRRAVHGTEVRI